jgi:hypothetical protein
MSDERQEFRLSVGEGRFGLMVAVLVGIVFLVVSFNAGWTWSYVSLSIVFAILFAVLAIGVWPWWRARERRESQLTFSRTGVTIREASAAEMPWHAIEAVRFVKSRGSRRNLALRLRTGANIMLTRSAQVLRPFRRWLSGGDVVLAIDPLEGETADVVEAARKFAPQGVEVIYD